jgi:hypothetical protein
MARTPYRYAVGLMIKTDEVSEQDCETRTNHQVTGRKSARRVRGRCAGSTEQGRQHHTEMVGFGTFSVMSPSPRKGRNPQTGREIFIPASKTAKFRAGKGLREAIK